MATEKVYQDIGAVTAYAYAVSKGYIGTEEQFATELAQFAQNAQKVAEDRAAVEQLVDEFLNTTAPAVIQDVTDEGTSQVERVAGAGTAQVTRVGQAGDAQIDAVATEGTTQIGLVTAEGTAQVTRVQDKGDEVIDSIPADYTALTQEVSDLNQQLSDVEENQIPELKIGYGLSNGNPDSNPYVAYTPAYYSASSGYIYTGAANDGTNALILHINEYDAGFNWLRRQIKSAPTAPLTITVGDDCAWIRFVFGRASSTEVRFAESDISYFGMTVIANKADMIPIPKPIAVNTEDTVNAMYAVVESYLNYAWRGDTISGIIYLPEGSQRASSPYSATCEPIQIVGDIKQYSIQCSGFANLVLKDIPIDNSRIVRGSAAENVSGAWGYNFDNTVAVSGSQSLVTSWELLKYADAHGYSYLIANDASNVRAGDLVFLSNSDAEGQYKNIGHVMVCLDANDGQIIVAEGIDTTRSIDGNSIPVGVRVHSYPSSYAQLVYGARFPLGDTHAKPGRIECSDFRHKAGTATNSAITSVIKNLPQGLYTFVIKGTCSDPLELRVRYAGTSNYVSMGQMICRGNIYSIPVYVSDEIDVMAAFSSSGAVYDIGLTLVAHGYVSADSSLLDGRSFMDNPSLIGPVLAEGDDLDDCLNGVFSCNSGTIASTLLHCPTSSNFRLETFQRASATLLSQIIYSADNAIYLRNKSGSGWGSWFKFTGMEQ